MENLNNLAVPAFKYSTAEKELIDQIQAFNHLKIILDAVPNDAGFIELRTFAEGKNSANKFPRPYFLPTNALPSEIEAAVSWSEIESRKGRGIFIGLNPRSREEGTKDAVKTYSSAFLDLDLDRRGIDLNEALDELKELSPIPPGYILKSGGGLHVVYFFTPTDEEEKWKTLQETLFNKFQHIGADGAVTTDSSRVLRLAGFPNWKYDEPRKVEILELTTESKPSFNQIATLFDVDFSVDKVEKTRLEIPTKIIAGGRNTTLHKAASRLRGYGHTKDEIQAIISVMNEDRCIPPLPESEIISIVESVGKYTQGDKILQDAEAVKEIPDSISLLRSYKELSESTYPPIDYIIYGGIAGEVCLVSGKSNEGKSTFVEVTSVALAAGKDFLNMTKAGKPRKVALFTFETTSQKFQRNLKKIVGVLTPEETDLVNQNLFTYIAKDRNTPRLNLSEKNHFKAFESAVKELQPDVIVIDTISTAFALKNENDNSEVAGVIMKPLQKMAKNLNALVVIVHHIGKANEEGSSNRTYRSRGASNFVTMSQSEIHLEKKKTKNGAKAVHLNLAKTKEEEMPEVVLKFNPETLWSEIDSNDAPSLSQAEEGVLRLVSLISKPMKKAGILEESKLPKATCERYLEKAIARNLIERGSGVGIYQPFGYIPPDAKSQDKAT